MATAFALNGLKVIIAKRRIEKSILALIVGIFLRHNQDCKQLM
jgi:hypothetical protein